MAEDSVERSIFVEYRCLASSSASGTNSDATAECRFCGQVNIDSSARANELISPCRCKGSLGKVHVECLRRWIQYRPRNSSSLMCEICHGQYCVSVSRNFVFGFDHMCTWGTLAYAIEALTLTLSIICLLYILLEIIPSMSKENTLTELVVVMLFLSILLLLSLGAFYRLIKRWCRHISTVTIN